MDNAINNATLSSILDELKFLNNNLSNGNLLGGDNRMFTPNGNSLKDLIESRKSLKKQKESLESEKNDLIEAIGELKENIDKYNDSIQNAVSPQSKGGLTKKLNSLNKDLENASTSLDELSNKSDALTENLKSTTSRMWVTIAQYSRAILTSGGNAVFSFLEGQLKKQGIKLQAASELQTRAIQTYGKALNNAIGVQVGNITGTVLDTAYQSLNAVIDGGRSFYMKSLSDAITYRRKENELYKANIEMASGMADGALGIVTSFGGTAAAVANILQAVGNVTKRTFQYLAAKTEFEIKQSEEVKKNQDEWLQQIEGVVKQFADMSKQVTKSFLEAGNSAYAYSRTLGLSGSGLRQYHDALIESVNVAMSDLAMDFNDYMKMQNAYAESTGGRAAIVGTDEARLMGGLSMRLGVGADQVASITGGMNVFNTSIEDGSEMIYKMANMANKMGLSATKFAKDLEKNLKLAEKYQFRGGVKGMMEMALWAQRTRFNVDSLSGIMEKALSGNIEDIMQTSARLNVLGGNAALLSDPMSLMFDAMDPKAMGERINKMVAGYGTFNRATGETEFSYNEMLRMQQIAQTMGMSREELMNQARQAQKENVIEQKYGGRFDRQTLEGLTQHATWSKDKNDWIIKVNAPGTENGFEEKTLDKVKPGDLDRIFPEDKQDTLIQYVNDIRNYLSAGEWQKVSEKYSMASIMSEASKRGIISKEYELADKRIDWTKVNKENYAQIIDLFTQATIDSQDDLNSAVNSGDMSKLVGNYTEWSRDNYKLLLQGVSSFVESGQSIEQKLQEIKLTILGITDKTDLSQYRNKKGKLSNEKAILYNSQFSDRQLNDFFNKTTINGKPLSNEEASRLYSELRSGKKIKGFQGYWDVREDGSTYVDSKYRIEETLPSKTINDAVITPRGTVYTHPDDMIAAFKPGGVIANVLSGSVGLRGQDNKNRQRYENTSSIGDYFVPLNQEAQKTNSLLYSLGRKDIPVETEPIASKRNSDSYDGYLGKMLQEFNGLYPLFNRLTQNTPYSDSVSNLKQNIDRMSIQSFENNSKGVINNSLSNDKLQLESKFSRPELVLERSNESIGAFDAFNKKMFNKFGVSTNVNEETNRTEIQPRWDKQELPQAGIQKINQQKVLQNDSIISKIEVSGTLKLDTNGQSVDLMELIKNDSMAWTRLTEGIIEKGFQNKYGRSPHAPQRYTFG